MKDKIALVVEQGKWIEDHGLDLAGYRERYGIKPDPRCIGEGGDAIYRSDMEELAKRYRAAGSPSVLSGPIVKGLENHLNQPNLIPELSVLIEGWQEKNKAWHFEGESGIRKLELLVESLQQDYTSILRFLGDNPGAMEAIVEWLKNQNILEWRESLSRQVGPVCPVVEEEEEEIQSR